MKLFINNKTGKVHELSQMAIQKLPDDIRNYYVPYTPIKSLKVPKEYESTQQVYKENIKHGSDSGKTSSRQRVRRNTRSKGE